MDWMEHVTAAEFHEKWDLKIMYSIHGKGDLTESELGHLDGYAGSKPVRIGNEAAEQFQMEIYGEVLTCAYELARRGFEFEPQIGSFLTKVAEHVQQVWTRPDYGIWEVRGQPRHFTYSKIMAWVAMDRAIHLARHFGLAGNVQSWIDTSKQIRRAVLEHGYDAKKNSFVMDFDSQELDAANLRIGMLEFLPADDPRVRGTIDMTMRELSDDGLVYRYLMDDGLPGKEGAFGLCSFWLVEALALAGRTEEAESVLDKMAGLANHVRLYSEQFDPATGDFLGNFPQAFTHLGLINSVLYLAHARGKNVPETAPIGTEKHRRQVQDMQQ